MVNFSPDLTALLDALPFYVILFDENQRILFANKTTTTFLKKSLREIVDQPCPQVMHGCEGYFPDCPLAEAVKTNLPVEREIFDPRTKRWLRTCIYPTTYRILNVHRIYYYVVQDITRTKAAEEQLEINFQKLQKSIQVTIEALVAAFGKRDPYATLHQKRVAGLAYALALEMGLDRDRAEGIKTAGLIHDIGKIYVPAEILSKPSKLSAGEYNIIKTHPQVAYDILKDIPFPWPVAQTVLQHHERLDGSGYPQGLSGDNIILEARILAVANVVEGLASHRSYRPALGIKAALDEIKDKSGTQFDAGAVTACIRLFNEKNYQLTPEFKV